MDKIIMVYVPTSSRIEAEKIGSALVDMRIAACANIIDNVTSIYNWEGNRQKDQEAVLLLKTRNNLVSRIEEEVKKIHSYSCPCIMVLPSDHINQEYAQWVISETTE